MRADKYLVEHRHFESRNKAREAIEAGLVFAGGKRVKKPSETILAGAIIQARAPYPWVSRAGLKLAHALDVFAVSANERTCLDVGASTGGFTHVLLAGGAERVYAVDVGHSQLHASLVSHDKVISMENCDARGLTVAQLSLPPSLIVCDVSFISAMKALARPLELADNSADLITLVKPQFEVGRAGVGKGGIVRDEALAHDAIARMKAWLTDQGWTVVASDISPIRGSDGNTEYLLHARKR